MTTAAVCPNGHAMDDGLFECPACGAYRPSAAQREVGAIYRDACNTCHVPRDGLHKADCPWTGVVGAWSGVPGSEPR